MEIKTLFIIGGILVVAFILKSCISNNNSKNESRPKNAEIPTEKIQNDKIVLFENVKSEDLKNAIVENEHAAKLQEQKLHEILGSLPNLPAADVPDGDSEENNKEILRTFSTKVLKSLLQHQKLTNDMKEFLSQEIEARAQKDLTLENNNQNNDEN